MEGQAPPLQVLVCQRVGGTTLAPRFSVNADSEGFNGLCFVALLQVLILKGLAKRGFWGSFEGLGA
jgi:hypothetical protein